MMKIGNCYIAKAKFNIRGHESTGIFSIDSKIIKTDSIVLFCGTEIDSLTGSKIYSFFHNNELYKLSEGLRDINQFFEELPANENTD